MKGITTSRTLKLQALSYAITWILATTIIRSAQSQDVGSFLAGLLGSSEVPHNDSHSEHSYPPCPGECVHAITAILCSKVIDQLNCGATYLRCCVPGDFNFGTIVETSAPLPEEMNTVSDTTDYDIYILTTAPSYKRTVTTAVDNYVTSTTSSPVNKKPSLLQNEEIIRQKVPCPGICVENIFVRYCGTTIPYGVCNTGSTCCASSSSEEEEENKPSRETATVTIITSNGDFYQKNIETSTPTIITGSKIVPAEIDAAIEIIPTTKAGPSCPGTCVAPLFSLLCDVVKENYYCPNDGRCCISEEDETPPTTTQPPIIPCAGVCIPTFLSGMCIKPSELIFRTNCDADFICCYEAGRNKDVQHSSPPARPVIRPQAPLPPPPGVFQQQHHNPQMQHNPPLRRPPLQRPYPNPIPIPRPRPPSSAGSHIPNSQSEYINLSNQQHHTRPVLQVQPPLSNQQQQQSHIQFSKPDNNQHFPNHPNSQQTGQHHKISHNYTQIPSQTSSNTFSKPSLQKKPDAQQSPQLSSQISHNSPLRPEIQSNYDQPIHHHEFSSINTQSHLEATTPNSFKQRPTQQQTEQTLFQITTEIPHEQKYSPQKHQHFPPEESHFFPSIHKPQYHPPKTQQIPQLSQVSTTEKNKPQNQQEMNYEPPKTGPNAQVHQEYSHTVSESQSVSSHLPQNQTKPHFPPTPSHTPIRIPSEQSAFVPIPGSLKYTVHNIQTKERPPSNIHHPPQPAQNINIQNPAYDSGEPPKPVIIISGSQRPIKDPPICPGPCIAPFLKFTCFGNNAIYNGFSCTKAGTTCCASVDDIEKYEEMIKMNDPSVAAQPHIRTTHKPLSTSMKKTVPYLCGVKGVQRKETPRVVGGHISMPGEWCWQVALINANNQYLCGGALIGSRWILTAAHCITSLVRNGEPIYIRVGDFDLASPTGSPGAQTQRVSTSYIHHNHNGQTLDNDIALLKLENPVQLNDNVCIVCLPARGATSEPGNRCTVTGYGYQSEKGPISLKIREAELPIVEDKICVDQVNNVTEKLFILPTGSFCAGGELGHDACQGDGGGPLVCKNDGFYDLMGLVSWGFGCGKENVPGVYVKVSSFIGWINQIISVNN